MQELDIAIAAAKSAGEILRKHFVAGVRSETKNFKDVVTIADREAQDAIKRVIKAAYPEDGFFAEEDPEHHFTAGRLWVIDPLDGTVNFSRGIPLFGVSIAFLSAGDTRCGVIYLPHFDELYSAAQGTGAFCNGKPISVSALKESAAAVISMGDYNIGDRHVMTEINSLKTELVTRIAPHCMRIKNLGSAATEIAYVASGRFDAYFMLSTYFWDIAAGMVIVEEAGGRVTDYHGNLPGHESKCVLFSNGKMHHQYLDAVDKAGDSLQDKFSALTQTENH